MSFPFKETSTEDIPTTIHQILNLARADTLFWDRYIFKARTLLAPLLSYEAYRAMEKEQASVALLPDKIRSAMEAADWQRTEELSGRLSAIRTEISAKRPLIELGQLLYDTSMVPIDPFSPGLQGFTGVTGSGLIDLRKRCLATLERLEEEDSAWKAFYQERNNAFQTLALDSGAGYLAEQAPLASSQLQQEAIDSFKRGNFDRLKEVAGRLATLGGREVAKQGSESGINVNHEAGDWLTTFPATTLAAAGRLGMESVRAESWHAKYGHLCRLAWHPAIGREGSLPGEAQQLFDQSLPADTPEAMKERFRMFMIHPFINSGGSRYLPSLVAEDALVESFPEPEPGGAIPTSPLLDALQLSRRDSLSRLRIEQALLDHGTDIVSQIGLDPIRYRLVCIPPDLHLRLGLRKNWGKQPLWTHFDGYMIQRDGHRMALAGGDIRFGGVFDMVGIGVNYESDRVFVRFAVVQRKRMAAW